MKKIPIFITVAVMLLNMPLFALAKTSVQVVVRGEVLQSDVEAEIIEDRTFVPIRAIAEKLGAQVEWKQESQGIKLKRNGMETGLAIGSLSASITRGNSVSPAILEAAPYIKDDRTFVPLRFIAQGLGSRVCWCDEIKTAVITENYAAPRGLFKQQIEYFFSVSLPQAIKTDGALIAADIEKDPQSVMNYFANLWTDYALELAKDALSEAEGSKFLSLSGKEDRQYEYLLETAQAHEISVECPIKMCSVKNNGCAALVIDAPAQRTAEIATQCILLSVNGQVSAVQL